MVQGMRNPLDELRASYYRAGHDIGMSVQVLGPAMQRQIEADFRGAKINRTRESIVDDRNQPVLGGEATAACKSLTWSSGFDIAST